MPSDLGKRASAVRADTHRFAPNRARGAHGPAVAISLPSVGKWRGRCSGQMRGEASANVPIQRTPALIRYRPNVGVRARVARSPTMYAAGASSFGVWRTVAARDHAVCDPDLACSGVSTRQPIASAHGGPDGSRLVAGLLVGVALKVLKEVRSRQLRNDSTEICSRPIRPPARCRRPHSAHVCNDAGPEDHDGSCHGRHHYTDRHSRVSVRQPSGSATA